MISVVRPARHRRAAPPPPIPLTTVSIFPGTKAENHSVKLEGIHRGTCSSEMEANRLGRMPDESIFPEDMAVSIKFLKKAGPFVRKTRTKERQAHKDRVRNAIPAERT